MTRRASLDAAEAAVGRAMAACDRAEQSLATGGERYRLTAPTGPAGGSSAADDLERRLLECGFTEEQRAFLRVMPADQREKVMPTRHDLELAGSLTAAEIARTKAAKHGISLPLGWGT